ncbi:hypothetical protein [Variovorax sp. GB1P17]
MVEEFFPDDFDNGLTSEPVRAEVKPGLADKLNRKATSAKRAGVTSGSE